ncbi:MAG TPA: CAP domain-containing protein [Acidimicrobiales bacterium]|nr:CAP domain-containing protein [Acidimicrobiales bacterium]
MRRIAAGLVVMFMSVLGVVGLGATAAHADTIDATAEAQFVTLINALRASKGLGTLTVDSNLTSIARNWSQQMANAGTISHNPNFPNQVTSDWQMLGENVGQGYTVQSLFDAFVASPHHYENLVEPSFTRVGVGVVVTASGQIFTSHQFMSLRSGGGSAPAPAPTTHVTTPRASTPRTTAAPRVTTPRPATTSAPRSTAPAATAAPAAPTPAPAPAAAAHATPPARFVLALQQLESFDPSN